MPKIQLKEPIQCKFMGHYLCQTQWIFGTANFSERTHSQALTRMWCSSLGQRNHSLDVENELDVIRGQLYG